MFRLSSLIAAVALVACQSQVKPESSSERTAADPSTGESPADTGSTDQNTQDDDAKDDKASTPPALAVTSRHPLVVRAGSKVELTGQGFTPQMTLALAGTPVSGVTVKSDAAAEFTVPAGLANGILQLTATSGTVAQTVSLIFSNAPEDKPVFTGDAALLCSDQQFYDLAGTLKSGTKSCPAPVAPTPPCAEDGAADCIVDGTNYKAAKLANFTAADVKSTVTIAGVDGTGALSGANCTTDGEFDCVATAAFPAADTSSYDSWDVRAGKQVGGVDGTLAFFKNMTDVNYYDRASGTASAAGADVYDTVDDDVNNHPFPTTSPDANWVAATGANWIRDAASDTGTGMAAGNGACDAGEDCVWLDRIAGTRWTVDDATTRHVEDGITFCDGLNGASFGTYSSGWRLPTQKELMQAYTDGIWAKKTELALVRGAYYWSSTYDIGATKVWNVTLSRGYATSGTSTVVGRILCVH